MIYIVKRFLIHLISLELAETKLFAVTWNRFSAEIISTNVFTYPSEAPLWPKEVLEPVVVSEGSPLVLACNPPPGLPPPKTFWMDSSKSALFHFISASPDCMNHLFRSLFLFLIWFRIVCLSVSHSHVGILVLR